ncbi:UNVERIFIED_CONTAM: hypothetical protein FKN15_004063, partial [Acipenser sinensis]
IKFQSKVLETVNIISKLLQSKDMDLFLAAKMLNSATKTFISFRKQFGETTASSLASSWVIEQKFTEKRLRQKHFDELCEDQRLSNREEHFKVAVFYTNIDIIVTQLKTCFCGMKTIVQRFHFMSPSELLSANDDTLFKSGKSLAAPLDDAR